MKKSVFLKKTINAELFKVTKTVNTLEPVVGSNLTKSEVLALIAKSNVTRSDLTVTVVA